jgi:hypothetical protein
MPDIARLRGVAQARFDTDLDFLFQGAAVPRNAVRWRAGAEALREPQPRRSAAE